VGGGVSGVVVGGEVMPRRLRGFLPLRTVRPRFRRVFWLVPPAAPAIRAEKAVTCCSCGVIPSSTCICDIYPSNTCADDNVVNGAVLTPLKTPLKTPPKGFIGTEGGDGV